MVNAHDPHRPFDNRKPAEQRVFDNGRVNQLPEIEKRKEAV